MSDDMANERVTLASVYRAVDDQGKLMTAQFESVHLRLDSLSMLPERVTRLEGTVKDIQDQSNKRSAYRTAVLTTVPVGALGVIAAFLQILIH
jgi:hypothetical protein